jgi:hypothetical protein
MQNAELYRRGIVLPLDEDAEESLRTNDVTESTNVRLLRIASDALFEALWETGFFQEVNTNCSTLIGDYEEELVGESSVGGILAAVESVTRTATDLQPAVVEYLAEVKAMVQEAIDTSRPVLFIL